MPYPALPRKWVRREGARIKFPRTELGRHKLTMTMVRVTKICVPDRAKYERGYSRYEALSRRRRYFIGEPNRGLAFLESRCIV